jgi:RNA methyltransferase, TrmH family
MLTRSELRRLRALGSRKGRAESGLFLAEGVRLVEDLLATDIVLDVALVTPSLEDTPRGAALARALRTRVRTAEVTERELAVVAGTDTPQGVVVAAEIPRRRLADVVLTARALVLVLDGVQDPGNFGTVVRSADAFGVACVLALPGTVDPWNPKAVRSAMGASLRVPIVGVTVTAAIEWLRSAGCRILGADVAGVSVERIGSAPRTALVLGNEGVGLSEAIRTALDGMVAVPIRGAAESLNVGVAAGILLYLLTRES